MIGGVFALRRWNDYREKDLVVALEANEVVKIHYGLNENLTFGKVIDDEQVIQEWANSLGEYRVKKDGPRNFTSKYPGEQIQFQLEYEDERITIPIVIERNVILIDLDQYTIINGPIDADWIDQFLEN